MHLTYQPRRRRGIVREVLDRHVLNQRRRAFIERMRNGTAPRYRRRRQPVRPGVQRQLIRNPGRFYRAPRRRRY